MTCINGDIEYLEGFDVGLTKEHNFSLRITSDVLLKEVRDLRIFKKNGETREMRTKVEAHEAAKLI